MRYKLGELIELSTDINSNGKFKAKDVRGMTITKEVIPTKADVKSTDLSKFLVVEPNEFIYNPRTHGKKIGLGFNNTNKPFIISWNNIAFKVKDRNILNPTYLFMHFNRTEWDRQAVFDSWGSSTEVFSWSALCDMVIDLPPLAIQEKYVDVYNTMIANQKAYENGLEDLKLLCDATIEKLRRELPFSSLKGLIDINVNKNEKLEYDVDSVRGISNQKKFIETKAKMQGVSLKPYLIVAPDEFAFVTVTSRNGEKISIAHNNSKESYLCSSSYVSFRVLNTERLLPGFLSMFIRRTEFDRYARFHSWGSARETFNWEDMQEVEIPIPDMDTQKSIVEIYNTYITRKEINEKLKQQIKDICPILIKGAIKEVEFYDEI